MSSTISNCSLTIVTAIARVFPEGAGSSRSSDFESLLRERKKERKRLKRWKKKKMIE